MIRKALAVLLAFLLGAAVGVAADRWAAAPEQLQPEQRFVVNWWPEARCPPPSSIVPRVTRPL